MKLTADREVPYTDPDAILQARVLKVLKPCLSYWLDEQTLYLTLNLSRPAVTRARLEHALRELRDKAYLDFRVDPLSRLTEWRLTPSGHALAQTLNASGRAVNRKGAFLCTDGKRTALAFMRGLGKIPTSFSMDVVVQDEKDDLPEENARFLSGRMTASSLRLTLLIGTQRYHGAGQNLAFTEGTQHIGMLTCTACAKQVNPETQWPGVCRLVLEGVPSAEWPKLNDIYLVIFTMPASTNPTLSVVDPTTSTALVSKNGSVSGGTTTLEFEYTWSGWLRDPKGAYLLMDMGAGVNTALGIATGTSGGLPVLGAGGYLQTSNLPALTGDATSTAGTNALTVSRINGVSLAGLATGLLKNTTGTGGPSIAVGGTDYEFPLTFGAGVVRSGNNVANSVIQNLQTDSYLATDGLVYASSGTGALNSGWTLAPTANPATAVAVSLSGGAYSGSGTANAGGAVTITGGATSGSTTSSVGGAVSITGGAGSGTNATGGNVTITGGAKNGTGSIGNVVIGAGSAGFCSINTAVLTTGSGTGVTFSGLNNAIHGTTSVANASAGYNGEYVNSAIAAGSAVSLATATATNVTSISLTAGDWDVEGNVNFSGTSATTNQFEAAINTTSSTFPADGSECYSYAPMSAAAGINSVHLPRKRINVATTTTIYLVGSVSFTGTSEAGYGTINARRVR